MAFCAMPFLSDAARKVAHVNKSEKGMAANHQIHRVSLGKWQRTEGNIDENDS